MNNVKNALINSGGLSEGSDLLAFGNEDWNGILHPIGGLIDVVKAVKMDCFSAIKTG